MTTSKSSGFTLIELMIAVALVGILAAVAYPTYMEQVRKARRADAQASLLQLAGIMERFYTENNSYTGACLEGDGDASCTQVVFPNSTPLEGGDTHYTLSAVVNDAGDAYDLTAARELTSPQIDDKCGTLSLSSTGQRGISDQDSGVAVDDCW